MKKSSEQRIIIAWFTHQGDTPPNYCLGEQPMRIMLHYAKSSYNAIKNDVW